MRPLIFDMLFNDDRIFVLEISRVKVVSTAFKSKPQYKWAVITKRNLAGYPPYSTKTFSTYEIAKDYYLKVVVETPRKSLGEKSPNPTPSLDQYTQWLKRNNFYDPILNPNEEV